MLLGVDTGGTFTDFALLDGGALRIHKVLSTPAAPEQAILQGIRELGLEAAAASGRLTVIHGTTVATNAALERKGVRTAFITNRGFADLLSIGRQARRELYNLQPLPEPPPVPAELCLETGGRVSAQSDTLEPLSEQDLADLRAALAQLAPQAVAINLLFSFLDDQHERRIAEAMPEGMFVSRSSEVLPESGEYERGMATWLNAYLGPLVQHYLQRLERALGPSPLAVMQSSGETMAANQAGRHAVRLLLSGPAGGLNGARTMAAQSGEQRLLSFDMGGTSTDVAMIDGDLKLTREGRIGPWPAAVPMVDMHTIGAGGGSIAWLDAGGMLQVGPESAGAHPGPACYGQGGQHPTVTDANLVLGRLQAKAFLGGRMQLSVDAARNAIAPLASALGMSIEDTALGIVRIADEHMSQALRVISVQRGHDPRDFCLLSFGGAGGLHVCALAESLGMRRALVPRHGGVLSAFGMLAAPRGRQLSRAWRQALTDCDARQLDTEYAQLARQAREALAQEGVAADQINYQRSAELRYSGQSFCLNLPWQPLHALTEAFHRAHAARYGHALVAPVELVSLRLAAQAPAPLPGLAAAVQVNTPPQSARLFGLSGEVAVWQRDSLPTATALPGPLLVMEETATTFVAPGWLVCRDRHDNLQLEAAASRAGHS